MIKVNGKKIDLNHFPDGALLLKFIAHGNSINLQWNYESDSELFALVCATKHIRKINPFSDISLYMPYIPHARMDRTKELSDVFTLDYFAEIINSLNFTKVEVLDPHSWVSEKAIKKLVVNTPKMFILDAIDKINSTEENPLTLYYPDDGAYKRYTKLLQLHAIYGRKNRDWETGKILGLDVVGKVVKGSPIIMIDDIVSYGGSMHYSSIKLKELGCGNIYIFASHVENSILDEERGLLIKNGLIEKIYTTNSIFTKQHKLIEVIEL